MTVKNLDATEVALLLKQNAILLVDVREPDEFTAEHIPGALSFPLSAFDTQSLPGDAGRTIVFQCGSGIRSARAVAACRQAGLAHECHLKGGIAAWKAAGLPVER
jgi:rhodanese-related sulfurtransferase